MLDSVWISIDQTTNVLRRHIGNVTVVVLKYIETSKPVLNSEVLPKCNHQNIAKKEAK